MVRWSIVFLKGRKQGWSVTPLCLSLLFCVYIFWFMLCFFLVFYSVLGWCFRSWLCIFLGCVLCALLFWVDCSVFSGFFSPLVLGFLLPFIETHSLPLISPAFAGLYLPRTRSWARDVVHDWICCRFSGLRWNRDEEDHTALPLATATFRPKDTFLLFDPWTLEIRQLDP